MDSNTFIGTTPTLQTSYLTASDSYNVTNNTYPHCEHFKVTNLNDMFVKLYTIYIKLLKQNF